MMHGPCTYSRICMTYIHICIKQTNISHENLDMHKKKHDMSICEYEYKINKCVYLYIYIYIHMNIYKTIDVHV